MKTKITTIVVLFALFFLLFSSPANAQVKLAGMSATAFTPEQTVVVDNRAKALRAYLEQSNSPLADSAETFVKSADKYNLDWKLVAAIAGLESGYGHHIPYNSYNAWGWGVYGTNVITFASWDEGIETISKGLRERYMNQRGARNVYEIGSTYAASPTWAVRVESNMNRINAFYEDFEKTDPSVALPLSL
jgi:hypothetical protein